MAEPGKKALRSWRRLEKAHDLVSGRIEQALKAAGLPPLLWLRALEELERHGDRGPRPYELQTALDLEQPAVSRVLARMAAAGLIARRECADDRRGWTIATTPLGHEARVRAAEVYATALFAHFLAHLGEKQARSLDEILGDLLDSLRS